MGKAVMIDNFMHKWITITADKGPEFSTEARHNFDKLVGDEGKITFSAQVESVEWCDDEIFCIKFIHPYKKGSVEGFRYDLYDMDEKAEELFSTVGRKLKTGDIVQLTGTYANCDFGLWFSDPSYQNLPEKDGYYMISMDILNIQKKSSGEPSKVDKETSKSINNTKNGNSDKPAGIGKWIPFVIVGALLYSCFSGDDETSEKVAQTQVQQTVSQQENMVVQETSSEIRNDAYDIFKDYPIYSEEYTRYYINSGKLDIPSFYEELNELNTDLANANVGQAYVSPKGLFTDTGFKNEGFETDYLYVGELKDGQPHGVGTVYYNTYTGLTDISFKVYEGYFDDGEYDQFGIVYDLAYLDCSQGEVSAFIDREYNSEYQKYLSLYYNPIVYIGYFDGGKRNDEGVEFVYPEDEYKDYISGKYSVDDIQIFTGTYKNNEIVNGKMYVHEYLLYEGEFKDTVKHGIGRLYFKNTNDLAFEGTFKNDEVLKGTLYDPNGNVICEGEWTDGYCGIIDFYDEYYKYSNIEARDIVEDLGEEYGSVEDWERLHNLATEETVSQNEFGYSPTDYSDEYILPDSSMRYLTYDDLYSLDKATLRLARNEIFAKHGRKFETVDLNEYFSSKSWYRGYLSAEEFDDSVLNEYEKANLELIKSVEQGEEISSSIQTVLDGLYEDENIQIEIINYGYSAYTGEEMVIGDVAIYWPNDTTEWTCMLYDGTSTLTIMDMNGEIIGQMWVIDDQNFEIELYGERYFFTCIDKY